MEGKIDKDEYPPVEDTKPPAQDAVPDKTKGAESVPNPSEQTEDASNSPRPARNTKEFNHATNHLPTVDIPAYTRDFDSILTFPEKFMLMMIYIERVSTSAGRKMEQEAIFWALDGTAVVIRDPNALYVKWLWRFFGNVKYESFVRKVYRWRFRKSPPTLYGFPTDCQVFSHPYFCRDQLEQLCKIQSACKATTNRPAVKKTKAQLPSLKQNTIRIVDAAPNVGNRLQSLSDQNVSISQFPSQESVLGQQLLNLRTQSLLSDSLLHQLRNETFHEADALDWMRQRLRMNLTLPPSLPAPPALMQILRLENAGVPMQNPTSALEELIRRIRQNPFR